jgi:chromosomal replication initiation ATPase DnaA
VFTTPAAPGTLEGIEPRIISRLEGGLVVELQPPDREVRRTVLERWLIELDVFDTALLDYLADRPVDSTRALAQLVQRVGDAAIAQDQPLSAGLAREVLEGQPASRRPSGFRTSGIIVSSLGGIRSREKMVWDWADPTDRVIEDLR